MIDFEKIEEITIQYADKEKLECNAYVQIENTLQVNGEYGTVKVTMKSEKNREQIDPFNLIVKKKEDRYWIKSDYFEEEGEYYPVAAYEGDDALILVHRYGETILYIYIYY